MYRAATLSVVLLTTLGCAGPTKIAKLDQPPPRGQSLAHWIDRTTSLQSASKLPKAGEDFAMIYDPLRHRIVMFGGKGDDDKNTNDVWTFELARNRWQQVEIASEQPPASEDHTLIYDPIGYRMILYGGEDGPTWNNTYSFDLKTYQWIDLTDSTAPIREDHTAIYDSKGKRMVVFGGQDNDIPSNEIWTFDLNPNSQDFETWQTLNVEGELPRERYDHVTVYDSVENRMVIYGGWDDIKEEYLNDTWAFYFEQGEWKQIKTKKSYPPKRRHAVGVYDSARNWFIIQGGFGDEGYLNDVWAFDLTADAWMNITPGPQPRIDHDAIYDPKSQRLILYGGDAAIRSKFRDIWELEVQPEIPLDLLLKEAGGKIKKKADL